MEHFDPAMDRIGQDPAAKRLLGDPAALAALLASPETQRLMALLRGSGTDLAAAARDAAKGKGEALKEALDQIMSTPEGKRAAGDFQQAADRMER